MSDPYRMPADRASAERVAMAIHVRAEVVAWLRSAPNAVLSLPNTPADVLTPSAQRCVHLPQFVWDAIADAVERGAQEPRSGGEGDA